AVPGGFRVDMITSTARKLLIAALSLPVQSACDSGITFGGGEIAQVEIRPQPATVEFRETLQLQAVLMDPSGDVLEGPIIVHWSSENPDIAEVTQDGVVTGKSLGKTRIAASAQGVDGLVTVEVEPRKVF